MSDISIPGVSSKYQTQKLVEDLMKVERISVTRAEERLEQIHLQKTSWQDLNRRLSSLRESSRTLFSFQNPFNERSAISGDEAVLTGTASREAIEETKKFIVKQTAASDRFMSDPLSSDLKIAAGNYIFNVGESSIRLSYGGGSLKDFVDAINKKGGETVRAQLVAVRSDTRVLVLESLKPGAQNTLSFSEAAEGLALSIGLIEKAGSTRRELAINTPTRFELPLDTTRVTVKNDSLNIGPGAEAAIKLASPSPTQGLVLELNVWLKDGPRGADAASGPPSGPAIPETGSMDYEGVRILSAPSEASLPSWSPPPPPVTRDDFSPLYLIDGSGRSMALPPISPGSEYQTISVPLKAYSDSFSGIGIRNGNTGRDVLIQSAIIYDPTETKGMRPKNAVQTARDAIVSMDGIDITRPTNTISDLVPGLTVNLWRESDKPVSLSIEPNREAAKEALIDLIGNYNRLMAELNILARSDDKVLDEISYFTEDEKKKFSERLGLFQGDMTLSQLRSSLQRTMMDAYPTSGGVDQLAAFGISTDSRRGGSYDASRLRGYIEIDEGALDKALKDNFQRVKETFGYDTDGDLLTDSGAAFKLDFMTKAYVETGGIVSIRTRTLDDQASRQKKDIENLETQLVRKEADLKRKYGLMESALGQMESSSSAWDNFNSSQQK